jgi:hypothetical protein
MRGWHGAALFVVGVVCGMILGPRPNPGVQQETVAAQRDAAVARAEKAESELAALRETRRKPRETAAPAEGAAGDSRAPAEAVAAAPDTPAAKPAPLSREAREKRVADIVRDLHVIFENHDGEKALAALKDLAAIVPEGRDAAMKLAVDINADVNGPGELKLPMFTFYSNLGDPAVKDLMLWSLENQTTSLPGFRVLSAWSIPWAGLKPDEVIARYDAALGQENDRRVQSSIVANLTSMNTPKAEAVLSRVFGDATRDAALRAEAAIALALTKDPAIQSQIAAAANDPDVRIQAASKVASVLRDPPATGCLVTQTIPDGNADTSGIRPGDVIVSYNSRPVPTDSDLRRETDAAMTVESIAVVVVRDGQEKTLQVKPGRLGLPALHSVTKK